MKMMNNQPVPEFFQELYRLFSAPITDLDCGKKCGPFNDRGVPFCCDIQHTVPAALQEEWDFLQPSTDLWRLWEGSSSTETQELIAELQEGHILLVCQGYKLCQRPFRTLSCRAFPFFPYLDQNGVFLGLSYYQDYREECWVISNLEAVSSQFIEEFTAGFKRLFEVYPELKEGYQRYSELIRDQTREELERIVLLQPGPRFFLLDPSSEILQEIEAGSLPAFGPYQIIKDMPFPDELEDN
jgi:hypothetical protein